MRSPDQQLREQGGHERFVELCALYSSGSLHDDEVNELNSHLRSCESCRNLLASYSKLVRDGLPLLADIDDIQPTSGFDRELAQIREGLLVDPRGSNQTGPVHGSPGGLVRYWPQALITAAFGIVLAIFGYLLGAQHLRTADQASRFHSTDAQTSQLRDQLARSEGSRNELNAAIEARDRKLQALTIELGRQAASISNLRQTADAVRAEKSGQGSALSQVKDENAALKADRDRIARQLQDLEANLGQLNRQIEALQSERTTSAVQSADLQKRIDDLTAQTRLSQATISQQERLLASDRDVRELMGARDLLIADVFDVDQNGHNLPAFGRVFYTKNKSLIFYAFDLDKEPGLQNASTFQAWGTRTNAQGSKHPVNMGILYVDNAENRRWTLKFDNPSVLEQIDAVFVTAEPKGGSDKPRGKQRLYAYLRSQPNHP